MQPEKVFRHGACLAAIYANEIVKDGTVRQIRTVSFAKRYRDPQGEWQNTTSLSVNDLPTAILVLHKSYEYLTAISSPMALDDEEHTNSA
jgi:hypothetical protein